MDNSVKAIAPRLPDIAATEASEQRVPTYASPRRGRAASDPGPLSGLVGKRPVRRSESAPPRVQTALEAGNVRATRLADTSAAPASAESYVRRQSQVPYLMNAETPNSTAPRELGIIAKALKMSDLRTLWCRVDDREFLAQLREPATGNTVEQAKLEGLLGRLENIQRVVENSGAPGQLIDGFKKDLTHVQNTLRSLETDQPLAQRMAKVLVPNLLLAPLPFIVPLAGKPIQQQFASELFALTAKVAIEAAGMIRNPTTDTALVRERLMARQFINVVQTAEFILPTFVDGLKSLNKSPYFNVAMGGVSVGALFAGFMGDEIRQAYNKQRHKSPNPALAKAGETLTPAVREVLTSVHQQVQADQKALLVARETFVTSNKQEISPFLSKQLGLAVNAYQTIGDHFADTLGTRGITSAENPDRTAKMALAAFTTAVCAATTILMLPDKIGMVDLGADSFFTAALMFSLAANSNVSRQDALEEFKTFAGLSLVLVAVLAANQAADHFMEKGLSGLLIGSLTLSALNVTVPGPVGSAAALGIEKLMNMQPKDLLATLHHIGERAYRMLLPAQVEPSVSRIEALDEMEMGNHGTSA